MKFLNKKTARLFFSYYVPAFIGLFAVSVNVLVDGIFVGQFIGEKALAGVGISAPIYSVVLAIEMLFGIGGGISSSIFLGQGKRFKASVVFSSCVYSICILGIIFGITGFIYSSKIAHLLGSTSILDIYTIPYVRVVLGGIIFIMLHATLDSFTRNDNAQFFAMLSFIISSAVNIVLNYIFVGLMSYGVTGSGLATVLGHVVGTIMLLTRFMLKKGDLSFHPLFKIKLVFKAAKNGLPSALAELSFAFIFILTNWLLSRLGDSGGVATFSIIMYISLLSFSVIFAIAQGIQPILSFALGQKNIPRLLEIFYFATFLSFVSGALIYAFIYAFIPYIALGFLHKDSALIDGVVHAARIYFLGYLFMGWSVVAGMFLQSIERITSSFIISVTHHMVFMSILLPTLSYFFGINGVWMSYPIAFTLTSIVALVILMHEFKHHLPRMAGSLPKEVT